MRQILVCFSVEDRETGQDIPWFYLSDSMFDVSAASQSLLYCEFVRMPELLKLPTHQSVMFLEVFSKVLNLWSNPDSWIVIVINEQFWEHHFLPILIDEFNLDEDGVFSFEFNGVTEEISLIENYLDPEKKPTDWMNEGSLYVFQDDALCELNILSPGTMNIPDGSDLDPLQNFSLN